MEQAVERITGVDGPKATWGAIQLVDQETNELVFESVYAPKITSLRNRLGERRSLDKPQAPGGRIGITGRAVLKRMLQRVDDVRFDPDYVELDPTTRSELDVPLLDADKVVGVLGVEVDQPGAFDVEDERALQGLAELAVIAVKNADQAQQLSRTNAFAVMGAWGAEIAHEVNREVGHIHLTVASLQQQPELSQEVVQGLAEIDDYAERLGLPALPQEAPIPGQILEFQDAPLLDAVIREVIETAQRELRRQPSMCIQADLQCEGVRVAMHPYWLSRLAHHLIRNAVHSTVSDEKGNHITVHTRVQNAVAEVTVEDTGRGVSPDRVSLLFNQPVPRGDGHQGRGLLVVSYIAEVHGGSARLAWNRVGAGSCFAFSVPLAHRLNERRMR